MDLFGENEVVETAIDVMAVWQRCLADLQSNMSEKDLNQWIRPLQVQLQQSILLLLAPNSMWVEHVKDHYLNEIINLAIKHSDGALTSARIEMMVKTTPTAKKPTKASKKTDNIIDEGLPIDPAFTFDGFVKGKSNALAYSACNELSKKDSKHQYGPIFLYGSSGLGKTHLMHAMAHRYQKYGKRFCYFTKEHFFEKTLAAFRDKKIDQFVKNICKVNLLIIDDVHMVDSKKSPKVAEILMNLFDEFAKGSDKQIVLASDRPPTQMKDLDDRYISRFSAGLPIAIEPPDMEMRVQILEKKASIMGFDLPKDCAIFMAQNLPPDVRTLEGALKQVDFQLKLKGESISLAAVGNALKDKVEARARALNAENIRDLVAEYYEISPKDMMSKKRVRTIARPRQMAMALIRELTRDSFPEIGQVFGGRDHTTVMHACEKIDELRATDPTIDKDYNSLKMMLEFV